MNKGLSNEKDERLSLKNEPRDIPVVFKTDDEQNQKPRIPLFNNFSAPIIFTHKTNRVKSIEIIDIDQILNSSSDDFSSTNDCEVYDIVELNEFINDFEQQIDLTPSSSITNTTLPSEALNDAELLKDIENLVNTSPSLSNQNESNIEDEIKQNETPSLEVSNIPIISGIDDSSPSIDLTNIESYELTDESSKDTNLYENSHDGIDEVEEEEEEEEEKKSKPKIVYSKSFDESTLMKNYRIETHSSNEQMYSHFESLILDEGLEFIKAFATSCKPSECIDICSHIFTIFYKKERGIELMEKMIEIEVLNQTSSANLFRNNSITTHLMTCFTKTLGVPYLKSTIGPFILETFETVNQDLIHYEIDPSKIPSNQNLEQNISNLKMLTISLINQIIESKHLIPKAFLEICNLLVKCTKDKFPDSQKTVIGGFIFLRYICPALVVPDQYNIIEEEISKDHRRVLILASKILQTIANDKQFIDKESFMKCMNPLINEQKPFIQQFLKELCEPIGPDVYDNIIPVQIKFNDYKTSMTKFWTYVKSIKDVLLQNDYVKANKKIYNTLLNIENISLLKTSPIERATFRRHRIFN